MTEQELRDEFDKFIKTDQELVHYMGDPDAQLLFRKGYSLAQETIEKQKKEIEIYKGFSKLNSMNLSLLKQIKTKDKAIAEAREIIRTSLSFNGIKTQIEAEEKAKTWLENNR